MGKRLKGVLIKRKSEQENFEESPSVTLLTLKMTPEMVVPVLVNPGPFIPFISKTSLRLQRSKLNPPASIFACYKINLIKGLEH